MNEDREGRVVVNCTCLVPPPSVLFLSLPPSKMAPEQEAAKDIMVAAIDMDMMHLHMGHVVCVAMT